MEAAEEKDDEHLCISCRKVISGLEAYVAHRTQCCRSSTTVEAEEDFENLPNDKPSEISQIDFGDGFSTATDALASEAAFMENIGLYLNPRPALTSTISRVATKHDSRDGIDLLMWNSEDCENHEVITPKPKQQQQQSLLSFLNKSGGKSDERIDQSGGFNTVKWRLWNPDSENNDLWNDILSSAAAAAGDLYLEADMEFISPEASGNESSGRRRTSAFYCKPCNRSLCSKDAFYRHTLSELHFKRAATDQDEPKHQIREVNKAENKRETIARNEGDDLKCPTCGAHVPMGYGKHLVSHFHHHRSLGHPMQQNLVLSHIEDIVREAPFQCRPCRFYCNWSHYFERHWQEVHCQNSGANFWCSSCQVVCPSEESMLEHLLSENHYEISLMINRCVPIVIRQIQVHVCSLCQRSFRLGFGLLRHMRNCHGSKDFQLPMTSQQMRCRKCGYAAQSKKSMSDHIFWAHREKRRKSFTCVPCRRQFTTRIAAQRHKNSQCHHGKVSKDNPQVCHMCGLGYEDASSHFLEMHPEEASQCCVCGQCFASAQQLSAHVRKKGCSDDSAPKVLEGIPCTLCHFRGKSQSLLMLHVATVHGSANKLSCPVCNDASDFSSRAKLLHHLLAHDANVSRCSRCYALFPYASSALNHVCSGVGKKHYCCPKCAYVATKASSLKSHLLVHSEQRTFLSCAHCSEFTCTRQSELQRHIQKHRNASSSVLKCDVCQYSTHSRQHLSRHLKTVHCSQGETKKFHCRLCSYSSSGLDNLRKHILKTTKHPGASVYTCSDCGLQTNSQLDFRSHYLRAHPQLNAEEMVSHYFDPRK